MATAEQLSFGFIKIEDSPSPEPMVASVEPSPLNSNTTTPVDPRDPENFLKRCSGFNKKTKQRCNSIIGHKNQQNCHPSLLPTCRAHRDQESHAGWCQYQYSLAERCGRLFRWRPPYFELCSEHQGHPDTPCHFFTLPLELRHEIFRYLLPNRTVGSSTAALHDGKENIFEHIYAPPNGRTSMAHRHRQLRGFQPTVILPPRQDDSSSIFPVPLLNLLLVNRQIYHEVKDLLFSTVAFTIDVRKDGTFMCGRRLLEPRRADGSSHFLIDEADDAKDRFLKAFDWSAVKHYAVDILVENWADQALYPTHTGWDEEVEIYDIRDYVSVVVSGVLAKSRNLCKLQVRLCLADFHWPHEQILANTKIIVGPLERLRNVRQPQILGVFIGKPAHNQMLAVQRPAYILGSNAPICSVPPLPIHTPVLMPGMPDFDAYTADWARWISSRNAWPVTNKSPIRVMFTEFKDFYSKLSNVVPDVMYRNGKHAFLHRARVAREQEDIRKFRHLRNELIQYWYAYLEQEELKKHDMNARLSRMLDTDIYPSDDWDELSRNTRRTSYATQASSQSPVLLDPNAMVKEGIPMTSNPHRQNLFTQSTECSMQISRPGTSMNPQAGHMSDIGQAQRTLSAQLLAKGWSQQQMGQYTLMLQAQQQQQQQKQQQLQLQIQQRQAKMMAAQQIGVRMGRVADSSAVTATLASMFASEDDMSVETSHDKLYSNACNMQMTGNSECQIDAVDVDCFAHVNLTPDWCDVVGEPGPSTKKRRVDSGFSEMTTMGEGWMSASNDNTENNTSYVGKGKGKMDVEVICID